MRTAATCPARRIMLLALLVTAPPGRGHGLAYPDRVHGPALRGRASLVTAFSTLNSLVQENAPADLKGRILSIWGLAFRSGTPLGALVAGALVRSLGAPRVLGAFSGLLALLALGNLAWNPRVRDL
jgi:predicted MFS family arabinose efflux permease